MSIVDNIFSLIRKGKTMTKDLDDLTSLNTQSISRRAKASTCQFACLVPQSLSVPMGATIAKNMDRVYASFIQTVVASNPLIDISIDRSPLDYMKKLHQNLKLESVIDFEALETAKEGKFDASSFQNFLESAGMDLPFSEELTKSVMERVYNGEYRLYVNPTAEFAIAFKESAIPADYEDNINQLNEHMSQFNLRPFTEAISPEDVASALISGANSGAGTTNMDPRNPVGVKMLDRDAKRINELQPYGLQVRLIAVNEKKEFVQFMDFIIGIKTVLHVVKSSEIVDAIGNVVKNRNAAFNFVRWTTGEISLWKDIILHLDDIKTDTSYRQKKSNPFFPTLKRLKEKKVNVSLSGVNKLLPNSTLVLTRAEVDDIQKMYGVDVRDTFFAKKVLHELFLLTFIIVDDGAETLDILYDGDDAFETYTLETLERELTMSSNKLGKEIGRMISQ